MEREGLCCSCGIQCYFYWVYYASSKGIRSGAMGHATFEYPGGCQRCTEIFQYLNDMEW